MADVEQDTERPRVRKSALSSSWVQCDTGATLMSGSSVRSCGVTPVENAIGEFATSVCNVVVAPTGSPIERLEEQTLD